MMMFASTLLLAWNRDTLWLSNVAPLLFAIYFQAANEILTAICSVLPKIIFRTAKGYVFTSSIATARSINTNLLLTLRSKRLCMLMTRQNSLTPGRTCWRACSWFWLYSGKLVSFALSDTTVLSPRMRQCILLLLDSAVKIQTQILSKLMEAKHHSLWI